MKKIDFTKLEVQVSFDGTKKVFNVAKTVGNGMMYNGSVLLDVGFEDLARAIYYSDGEVEIPPQYVPAIIEIVKESAFIATIKRTLIIMLNG